MRVASTGLGQTELIADVTSMKPKGEINGAILRGDIPSGVAFGNLSGS